jgi:hypothetical protein
LPSIMFLNSVKLMNLLIILSNGCYIEEGMGTSWRNLAGMLLSCFGLDGTLLLMVCCFGLHYSHTNILWCFVSVQGQWGGEVDASIGQLAGTCSCCSLLCCMQVSQDGTAETTNVMVIFFERAC